MQKVIRRIIIVFVFGILICTCIGRATYNSYIDDTDLEVYLDQNLKTIYCDMGYDEDTNVGFVNGDEVRAIEDLKKAAIIIKGHLKENAKRDIFYECVLSTVVIDRIYVGNKDLREGDYIYFFEPVDCRQGEIDCTDGYNLMQEGVEYILFIKRLQNAGYGNKNQKYVYAPISTTYGKYLNDNTLPRLFKESDICNLDTAIEYSSVKNEEVFLCDKAKYEKYCRLKKQARELYGK